MPVTDTVELLRDAIGDILDASTTLQTLCGRATDIAREPFAPAPAVIPVMVFGLSQTGPDQWELELAAIAVDQTTTPAMSICNQMLEAAVAALTYSAFLAKSIEVTPLQWRHDNDTTLDQAVAELIGMLGTENRPSLRVGVRTVPFLTFT